jgi:hypothetical protein
MRLRKAGFPGPSFSPGTLSLRFRVPPECHATKQLASPRNPGVSHRSAQMRIRTLVIGLAIAAPLVVLESGPAAACDWLWGRGYGSTPVSYGYSGCAYSCEPRRYGYAPGYYGYAPSYYGGYGFYGRRWGWGWRGYGWRGYGFRGWRGYGFRGWHGARVAGFRGGAFRGGFHGRR